MRSRFWMGVLIMLLSTSGWTKARFMPKDELIQKSDAIVVASLEKVEPVREKGDHWSYSQKAVIHVEEVYKGPFSLSETTSVYGGENFICARTSLKTGRALLFLRRGQIGGQAVWVGTNWHLSVRPIQKDRVEWYSSNGTLEMKPTPLASVLREIEKAVTGK